jgi:hypothetical protein
MQTLNVTKFSKICDAEIEKARGWVSKYAKNCKKLKENQVKKSLGEVSKFYSILKVRCDATANVRELNLATEVYNNTLDKLKNPMRIN